MSKNEDKGQLSPEESNFLKEAKAVINSFEISPLEIEKLGYSAKINASALGMSLLLNDTEYAVGTPERLMIDIYRFLHSQDYSVNSSVEQISARKFANKALLNAFATKIMMGFPENPRAIERLLTEIIRINN